MRLHSSCLRAAGAVLFGIILFAAPGCETRGGKGSAERETEIVVAAASNLSNAFEELGRRFTARTGVRVTLSFGASGDLATQIENGAPFDVFASADISHVAELEQKGLIMVGSREVYARGRLVLWWSPAEGGARLARVEDLTAARVSRVAVANPEIAPYGRAAVESLQALNIWAEVEPKVVYAQNVSQARQFASTGNADAAFIPRSLVKVGEESYVEIEEKLHRPIEQALGIVSASHAPQAARKFTSFVMSEEGQELLESFGYARGGAAKPR